MMRNKIPERKEKNIVIGAVVVSAIIGIVGGVILYSKNKASKTEDMLSDILDDLEI